MDYQIAVCDDSSTDLHYLTSLAEEWAKQKGITVKMDPFSSAEEFLFHYAEEKGYDMLLLDIEMGDMDGVALAKEVRRENDAVQIVFVTGYSDYILEGYEVAALHYLMKPVNQEKLFLVLDRAVEKLKKNERVLHLELSGETARVPFRQIRFLEVRQNYVTVHGKEEYTVKKTLKDFEGELDERFFRAGRSYILNLSFVQRVTRKEAVLSDGEKSPCPGVSMNP